MKLEIEDVKYLTQFKAAIKMWKDNMKLMDMETCIVCGTRIESMDKLVKIFDKIIQHEKPTRSS